MATLGSTREAQLWLSGPPTEDFAFLSVRFSAELASSVPKILRLRAAPTAGCVLPQSVLQRPA